ncbi:TPA: hypothetical protein DCG86_08240, partial [Candidatus Marinimicrobia bacterium]|nr:hypothetical protein [Candidatus Neomarinimicrobiota bacterium]
MKNPLFLCRKFIRQIQKSSVKKVSHLSRGLTLTSILTLTSCSLPQEIDSSKLPVSFTGDAKIEVGSPFVGVS